MLAFLGYHLKVDEYNALSLPCAARNKTLTVATSPVVIIFANKDIAVVANGLYVHDVSVVSNVPYGNVTTFGVAIYRYAGSTGVIVPLVSVTTAAPIGHVSARLPYFKGSVAYAFARIHAPVINIAIKWRITPVWPRARITTATCRPVADIAGPL